MGIVSIPKKSKNKQMFTDQVRNGRVRSDRVRYNRVRNYRVRNDRGLEMIVNLYKHDKFSRIKLFS